MTKAEETIKIFFEILDTFPTANNGQKYLRLKNNQKLYFNLFIKKYGLKGTETKYSNSDVLRRIRMIEFFKYITRNFDIKENENRFFVETNFFRMVIVKTKKKKLELLSFYNFR